MGAKIEVGKGVKRTMEVLMEENTDTEETIMQKIFISDKLSDDA